MIVLLLSNHLYYSVLLHFPQRYIWKAIRESLRPSPLHNNVSSGSTGHSLKGFSSLMTTLAATVGTGNIIGMSAAIALGGPGAVFWCWITGLFGMATCYAECFLAVRYHAYTKANGYVGGPMQLLDKKLNQPRLAGFYAFLTIASAFGTGCMTQSNAITASLQDTFCINPRLSGLLLVFFSGLVILGGISSIATFCSRFMPVLCIFYLLSTLLIFLYNYNYLIDALLWILRDAFSLKSVGGEITGSCLYLSIVRYFLYSAKTIIINTKI
ncbi:MAG TPA: alanine:cation symporter family protein, partial [Lachnospiraceae bacterium]|nr:alanine:cation symporter family protein [Lachnospiraceae bacterium]